MSWRLNEPYAGGGHAPMIALEIIRFEKQENSPSGLVADARRLGRSVRPRQEQAAAGAARRPHDHPALAAAELCVLAEFEIQSAGEEVIASS